MLLTPNTAVGGTFASILYTRSIRSTGYLKSLEWRFSDTLNVMDEEFLVLRNGATVTVSDHGEEEGESSDEVVIRRDQVIIALPQDGHAGEGAPTFRLGSKLERIKIRAKLGAWPYTIEGTLHLPAGVNLHEHIHDYCYKFMAVTDATVTCHVNQGSNFKAPFVVVNRGAIDTAKTFTPLSERLQASNVAQESTVQPPAISDVQESEDLAQPYVQELTTGEPADSSVQAEESLILDIQISGLQAAEAIAGSRLFQHANLETLQEICQRLYEDRFLHRERVVRAAVCEPGAVVCREGDPGDTLYFVERGMLAVSKKGGDSQQDRHVDYLGPGDLFGEMSVLGDGRRTSTVRAVIESSLIAVHKDAVQMMMRKIPSATTSLLSIMTARQFAL